MDWGRQFCDVLKEQPCVLVTLNQISGSAPRESGSRMMVTRNGFVGSIGGGNLEFEAIAKARKLLAAQPGGYQEQERYGLGPALNQCCGGAVSLLFEVYCAGAPDWLDELLAVKDSSEVAILLSRVDSESSRKFVLSPGDSHKESIWAEAYEASLDLLYKHKRGEVITGITVIEGSSQTWWLEPLTDPLQAVMLFGAGHVGQAVARALAPLPFKVSWVDSRENFFPAKQPASIISIRSDNPVAEVSAAQAACIFLVMTHSHRLDEEICFEVLKRDDFAFLGLIGSETKRRRFVHRLGQKGIGSSQLKRLVCPIGLGSIRGKQPATIALSLAAQLMADGTLEEFSG